MFGIDRCICNMASKGSGFARFICSNANWFVSLQNNAQPKRNRSASLMLI